jgi:hypothetical protein
VTESVPRLKTLLRTKHVRIADRHPTAASVGSAWEAFKAFAAAPVASGQLSNDDLNDGLLFEFGTFDFGGKWGKTFEMDFVRQFATRNGDLQQLHLVIHFTPQVFRQLRGHIKAEACSRHAADCVASCSYADSQGAAGLLGTPCTLTLDAPDPASPHVLTGASVWSFDTRGEGQTEKRESWTTVVESSPLFRRVVSQHLRPIGFEVWRDSAD